MKRIAGLLIAVIPACGGGHPAMGDDAAIVDVAARADAAIDAGAFTAPSTFRVLAQYSDSQHGMIYANGKVYAVHAGSADLVEVIDATTYEVHTPIAVGHVPTNLATDGRYVFSANILARDIGDAYLSVIDTQTDTVVHSGLVAEKIQGSDPNNYPMTNFPTDVGVVGTQVLVVFPTNATPDILPVDIGTWTEHTLWNAGSGPAALATAGGVIAVNNDKAIGNSNDDAVELYTPSGTFVTELATSGILHWSVAVGGKIFLARELQTGPGQLLVIDPVAQTFHPLATEQGPYGVATANGRVYTVCTWAKTVDIFDAATEVQLASIDLATVAPMIVNPRGIAVSSRGDIYLESDNLISVLAY